jgi:hypothetical protein
MKDHPNNGDNMGVRIGKYGPNTMVSLGPRTGKLYLHNVRPKGVIPPHLQSYTESFKKAGKECAAEIGDVRGNARVLALNECVKGKLSRRK